MDAEVVQEPDFTLNQASRILNDGLADSLDENGDNKKKRTTRLIVDNPTLDLDLYTTNYTGHTKIDRLLFIADHCPPLAIDAYKLALSELKNTLNYQRYTQVHDKLNELLRGRGLPTVPMDEMWVENARKTQRSRGEKLERELKDYKSNLIKESIRMGHNDLGDHLYDCGDLAAAMKAYSRTRDYCTTPKHIVDMCMNVAKICIETGNFANVQSSVVKAENTPDVPDKTIVMSKLKSIMGLVHLEAGNFKRAAKSFLETSFALGGNFSEVISPNDIAVYGGLCALASFDRSELKSKVIDNTEFKQFLELEPQVRELISNFYHSKYAACLDLFCKMQNDLYLDMWLHGHVDMIYRNIRKKALIQYFDPFLSVDMNKMAVAFNTTVAELEGELARLITGKEIQARIDSHNKILRVKAANQRSAIFEKSMMMGKDYQVQTRDLLLRMKLVRNDLIVKDRERNSDRD